MKLIKILHPSSHPPELLTPCAIAHSSTGPYVPSEITNKLSKFTVNTTVASTSAITLALPVPNNQTQDDDPMEEKPTAMSSKDKKKGRKKSKSPALSHSHYQKFLVLLVPCLQNRKPAIMEIVHYTYITVNRILSLQCLVQFLVHHNRFLHETEHKPLVKDLATHVILDSDSNYSTCIAFHLAAFFELQIFCNYSPLPGPCTHLQQPWGEDSTSHHLLPLYLIRDSCFLMLQASHPSIQMTKS